MSRRNDENHGKLSKTMIFRDFCKFTKFNDPTNTGRPPQMVGGIFTARKRAFQRRFETFEQYFQHFPGFGSRYRVVDTTKSWKSWFFIGFQWNPLIFYELHGSVPLLKQFMFMMIAIFEKHIFHPYFFIKPSYDALLAFRKSRLSFLVV